MQMQLNLYTDEYALGLLPAQGDNQLQLLSEQGSIVLSGVTGKTLNTKIHANTSIILQDCSFNRFTAKDSNEI